MRREENERIKPAPVIDTLTQVYTVIGCLYVRTTLTSVVFALCRWPVHTNTHGEYKEERVKVGGERERERDVYLGWVEI